jgi:hypothetical protein
MVFVELYVLSGIKNFFEVLIYMLHNDKYIRKLIYICRGYDVDELGGEHVIFHCW